MSGARTDAAADPSSTAQAPSLAGILPLAAWAVVLLVVSLAPGAESVHGVTGPFGLLGLDGWLHLGGYVVLALLAGLAIRAGSVTALALVILTATAYGAGIESLQALLPWRQATLADVALNAAGATVGAGVWAAIDHRRDGDPKDDGRAKAL